MGIDIAYEVDGTTFTGYLADGSGGAPTPGVLVLHEASGLGPHVRQKAEMLAELGYVAFAPDLFGGPVENLAQASAYIADLSQDVAKLRRRCSAARARLRSQAHVDPARTAVIGFCFGGQAALELGRSGEDLRAIVGFHSGLKAHRLEDASNIKGKVLICLGDRDPLVPRALRDIFMDNMTDNEVDCQMLLHSGVGHSFTNPDAEAFGVPGCHYNAGADRRSWAAMQSLFVEVFAG